jgi:hypothetical protein
VPWRLTERQSRNWLIQQHQLLIGYAGIKSEAEPFRVLEGSIHVRNVQHAPLKKIVDKLEMTKQWSVDWQKVMITLDL